MNSEWFFVIGSLIAETTAISMVSPLVEGMVGWGIRSFYRCLDQKTCCPCDYKKTNVKTVQKFEAVYSGP